MAAFNDATKHTVTRVARSEAAKPRPIRHRSRPKPPPGHAVLICEPIQTKPPAFKSPPKEKAKIVLNPGSILLRPWASLKPDPKNARQHSSRQLEMLRKAIEVFGFAVPILIDEEGNILAGHARHTAAGQLGMPEVPVICISHLTPAQRRAFMIADNRLAELAQWDPEILGQELLELSKLDLNFSVELTGFTTAEIDLRINGIDSTGATPTAEDVTPPIEQVAVSRLHNLWQLGDHRLLCGNALEPVSYEALLGTTRVRAVITDPPYNVKVQGHVGGLGRVRHREFLMASGEMSEEQFIAFLATFLKCVVAVCVDGALIYAYMDWRHAYELLTAARRTKLAQLSLCCWNKDNAGMGSFYRSKHELVFVFKHGTGRHINNVELGRYGRYRTTVWDYPGANSLRRGRDTDLAMHPTVKPVSMIADIIRDCTARCDMVLDPFCGSGTIVMAAEKTGRVARAMELDPLYVDTAIRRWQQATGQQAVLMATGQTFDEVSAERLGEVL